MTIITPAAAPATSANRRPYGRDPRVDMLRGLSLMMVFINHIPFNALSCLTLRCYGFSDAAEIFVFLSGYSAWMCYPQIVSRDGWATALARLGGRCAVIWMAQGLLLLGTLLLASVRLQLTGRSDAGLDPIIGDGLRGLLRGLTFAALPPYLDILPLYVLLLAAFPVVMIGLRRSLVLTLLASVGLYASAALQGWNLPNAIDPHRLDIVWTFNPLTWQLVFVLGAAMAEGRSRGWRLLTNGQPALRGLCLAVLAYGFLAANPAHLWPGLAASLVPPQALDDGWKTIEAPWRLLHALALLYLVLTSETCRNADRLVTGRVLLACGRHSLPVFSVGCLVALIGRFAYADLGISPLLQLGVNGVGIGAQIATAFWLDRRMAERRFAQAREWIGPERRKRVQALRAALAVALGLGIVAGSAIALTHASRTVEPASVRHDYFPPPHLAHDHRYRIVAFGSSSTHGYGASSPAATYPAQLERLLIAAGLAPGGIDVVNRGLDGEDVDSMLGRIDDDILPRRPDLIIWQLGSNDAIHGATPARFDRALRAGLEALHALGVPLVLIGPQWNPDPARAALFADINKTMLAASRDNDVPMVDRFDLMQHWIHGEHIRPEALIGTDGLHMTDRGYALLAQAVFDRITTTVPSLRARMSAKPAD